MHLNIIIFSTFLSCLLPSLINDNTEHARSEAAGGFHRLLMANSAYTQIPKCLASISFIAKLAFQYLFQVRRMEARY
jgi:hypothetical protein